MIEAASQTQRTVADEEKYFRRLWPRPPRSRRLVVLTIVSGSVLILFGALAFWQITHIFSLIAEQRQHQRNVSDILKSTSDLDDLLTRNNSEAIAAIHAIDERSPSADIADLQENQVENRNHLSAGLAALKVSLTAYGQLEYVQDLEKMRALIEELARSREQMVAAYKEDRNVQTYVKLRDLMQSKRVIVTRYLLQMRANMNPALDASQQAIDTELNRAFFVSCATLGISGGFIFVLGWMLMSYVDKRDQVESHLRRATEMWIGIINSLKQGVAVYGYDQRLILWNPRYAELHRIDPDKLYVGMHAGEVMQNSIQRKVQPLEKALELYSQHLAAVKRGEPVERELPWVDGVQIQLAFHPMGSDHFVLTLTDMAQVRQAEQLARDQAVRLGTIMNNVPDAIVTINSSGSIESWNAAAEHMFGYKAAEIIHRNVSVLMNEPHASQHDYYLRRYLNEGDKAMLGRLREFTARRQDGGEFPIDLRISEMQLGNNRMFTGIIRDITERRAVEQMKGEFISTVSHELRTPLTSIIGSLSLLTDGIAGELPGKAQRLIGMAEKNSQRLGRLINDILDLEKAEAGRMTLQPEVRKLLPLLQHSLDINQSYAAGFNVKLRLKSAVESVSVNADEVRLLQVMSNLLSNAIKHSPAHSTVLVEVGLENEVVRVTVHDAGPGITEEFRPRVFQRFAQADGSDTRRVAGSGLGLAITKQLVELHGGTIGFDTGKSKVGTGSGTSFWYELPVIKTTPVEHDDHQAVGPLNITLVLCEDDPDVAEVMMEVLRHEGCSVRHASFATDVGALLDETVSVLLVDIDLPDSNGLNLVAELRKNERWRKLPVLMMSGKQLSAHEQQVLDELSVSAWLGKPVDRNALRAALRRIKT